MIPKSMRDAQGWEPGAEIQLEERPEGVLLRSHCLFVPTTIDEVAGCLRNAEPAKSAAEMEEVIEAEARRRWERFERQ